MIATTIALLTILDLPPEQASRSCPALAGAPAFGPRLVKICRRESRCSLIGVHDGDRPSAPRFYHKAVVDFRAYLVPDVCAVHRATTKAEVEEFGPRGPHGLAAAYSLRFLGVCVPPQALDNACLSALAATRRAQRWCSRRGTPNLLACPVRDLWAGSAKTRRRHLRTDPWHQDP